MATGGLRSMISGWFGGASLKPSEAQEYVTVTVLFPIAQTDHHENVEQRSLTGTFSPISLANLHGANYETLTAIFGIFGSDVKVGGNVYQEYRELTGTFTLSGIDNFTGVNYEALNAIFSILGVDNWLWAESGAATGLFSISEWDWMPTVYQEYRDFAAVFPISGVEWKVPSVQWAGKVYIA